MKLSYFLFLIFFILMTVYSFKAFSFPFQRLVPVSLELFASFTRCRHNPTSNIAAYTGRRALSALSHVGWDDPNVVKPLRHITAAPSHYDEESKNYDIFTEENSDQIQMNSRVASLLNTYSPSCQSILDVTCGTGSQVFSLTQRGYEVTGSDINERMLQVARQKVGERFPALVSRLYNADMRFVKLGRFDAAISMFNAVGHLTKEDFELAMRNIGSNLNKGGVYIFDIYNADYLRHGNNISKLTIDWIKTKSENTLREIQYSDIDQDGVLASYTIHYQTDPVGHHIISRDAQTLQVYTAEELVDMLHRSGFETMEQCGINGEDFSTVGTERIFTIAKLRR
jgi:SAM-dependent methyltransferase